MQGTDGRTELQIAFDEVLKMIEDLANAMKDQQSAIIKLNARVVKLEGMTNGKEDHTYN